MTVVSFPAPRLWPSAELDASLGFQDADYPSQPTSRRSSSAVARVPRAAAAKHHNSLK